MLTIDVPEPGFYSDYPSSVCSPWYCWFQHMGYPELDLRRFEDGEWAILQYMHAPLLPSEYRWQWALTGFSNTEISYPFIRRMVEAIDITKKEFWDREEEKTREVDAEFERTERHREDMVTRASKAIMSNPGLCERIAKRGIREMDLKMIRRHIPKSRF